MACQGAQTDENNIRDDHGLCAWETERVHTIYLWPSAHGRIAWASNMNAQKWAQSSRKKTLENTVSGKGFTRSGKMIKLIIKHWFMSSKTFGWHAKWIDSAWFGGFQPNARMAACVNIKQNYRRKYVYALFGNIKTIYAHHRNRFVYGSRMAQDKFVWNFYFSFWPQKLRIAQQRSGARKGFHANAKKRPKIDHSQEIQFNTCEQRNLRENSAFITWNWSVPRKYWTDSFLQKRIKNVYLPSR